MFRAKGTPRPQAPRFDWKIDSAIVVALLLSAGMGAAFVFYYPEAPVPPSKQAALKIPAGNAPNERPPEASDPSPTLPDRAPESAQLPAEGPSIDLVGQQPADPQASLGPGPSPNVTPGKNPKGSPGSSRITMRSPKARTSNTASKTSAAKPAPAKKTTSTKTSPKKK